MAERQTEVLIEKMLEFLYSDDEQDEETEHYAVSNTSNHLNGSTYDDDELDDDCHGSIEKKRKLDNPLSQTNVRREGGSNYLANEIKKLEEQFPLCGMQDTTRVNRSASPPNIDLHAPIWRSRTLSSLDCSNDECDTHDPEMLSPNEDWHNKLDQQRRNASNVYVQEVRKAFYGDAIGFPPKGTSDYYHVAQNYAIYGRNFLDFPDNWQMLLNDKTHHPIPMEVYNYAPYYGNGFYSMPHLPLNNNNDPAAPNVLVVNNFLPKQNMSGMTATGATAAAAAAAVAASPAYIQMCNGMQGPPRPHVPPIPGNTAAAAAAAYGMFLGNKVTYVAGPPNAPPLIYNQHPATTTNFISNTLANAGFNSTPPILYSNPMVNPNTPQPYLNTYFKDPQLLNAAANNNAPQNNTPVNYYERLVYAQMLQQQIYHQNQQQAAALAAMFQHKQRANQAVAAAAAARAAAAAAANGSNIPNIPNIPNNGNQPLGPPLNHNNNNMNLPPLNVCNRQAPMTFNNNNINPNNNNGPELIVLKPPRNVTTTPSIISANGSEEAMNFSD